MASQTISTLDSQPTFYSVAMDYLKKPNGVQNMVVQPALKTIKWAEFAQMGIAASFKGTKKILQRSSHLLFWFDFPSSVGSFWKSVVEFKESIVSGSLWDIGNKTTKVYINTFSVLGLFADAIEILGEEGLIPLSSSQVVVLEAIGFLGTFALFLSAMYGIQKQIQELMSAELGTPKFNLALMKLAGRVCLVVAAVFSMATFFQIATISTLGLLILSTTFLLLTLSSHFYSELVVKKEEKSVAN